MNDPPKPSARIRVLGYTLFFLVFVAFVALLEGAGFVFLRAQDAETYRPFLREGAFEDTTVLDTRAPYASLDPHLSHAQDPAALADAGLTTVPGFAVFGETGPQAALTIAVLGGSTTDPLVGHTWTRFLAQRLEEAGYAARVLNGGVAGYSSNQELLKLIRDVLPYEPDLILSLNGVNDLGYLHCTTNHPMVHPYQKKVLASVSGTSRTAFPLLPNAFAAATHFLDPQPAVGLHMGAVVKRPDYAHWFSNVRAMHAVAAEFGIPYRCFLQPILGVGGYAPSPEEAAMLESAIEFHAPYRDYAAHMETFYAGARDRAAQTDYIVDLTAVFEGRSGMYSDARHQTPEGSAVLAEAIFAYCAANGLLASATPQSATRGAAAQAGIEN